MKPEIKELFEDIDLADWKRRCDAIDGFKYDNNQ